MVTEGDVPSPIGGKCWCISNVFVHPEHRREGIASALVNLVKEQAEAAGIIYLHGSANASVEATMFWLNQGFTLNAYGRKGEDPQNPLLYGNYHHMMSYRMDRKPLAPADASLAIRPVEGEEIPQLIEKYTSDEKKKFFLLSKTEDLFGFEAIGDAGERKGVILVRPDSMQAPLDSTRWWMFLFVEPPYRRQGIGRSLVRHLYQYAQGRDVIQLSNIDQTEDHIGFWYEIGFDIFFWDKNAQTGRRAATAMLRVN
jgi:GNAT superfamily N-acetyltransferase